LVAKRGYDVELLREVIKKLYETGRLDPRFRTHKLQGSYNNYLECHIKSDWLLIWKQDDNAKKIMLTRTGTHTDLF
jgi:mRNA interferase YafQ